MKKIEIIWREMMEQAVKNPVFEQKQLATKFGFSTSTVFASLTSLRNLGAVSVTGRNFRITSLEKLLLFWATHRNLNHDIVYQTHIEAPVLEIEGLMDDDTIYGCYSATRFHLKVAPSEYDKVFVYSTNPENLKRRFPASPLSPNFFVLKADPFLSAFGKITPVSQTYVDLFNLKDWYAGEFLKALKEKYYGFLQ